MMYMVTVSIQGTEESPEYANLFEAMKALGNWSNRLGNTWIIECQLSAVQIRDLLKGHIKAGQDRLFVAEFIQNWAGTGMGTGFPEWIQRRNFRIVTPPDQTTANQS